MALAPSLVRVNSLPRDPVELAILEVEAAGSLGGRDEVTLAVTADFDDQPPDDEAPVIFGLGPALWAGRDGRDGPPRR